MDRFLIKWLYGPIANKIDYHWHKNHYDCAACSALGAATFATADGILRQIESFNWWDALLLPFAWLGYWAFVNAAKKCSRSYERRPDALPLESQLFYSVVLLVLRHAMVLVVALFMFDLLLTVIILLLLHKIIDSYDLIHSIRAGLGNTCLLSALYFAIVPKPPRKRKEKKGWSWMALPAMGK